MRPRLLDDEPWHNPGCHTWLALIAAVLLYARHARRSAGR
jgi:hypothetical protein